MPVQAGCVVKSIAGHDAGKLYLVVWADDRYVTLADGKVRMLEKPKRKSRKHIRKTNRTLEITNVLTNKKLREALSALRRDEGGNLLV